MANELVTTLASGMTLYARVFNASGQVWNGTGFIAENFASSVKFPMTDVAGNGRYTADCPVPALSANAVSYEVRLQSGSSPALSDNCVDSELIASNTGIIFADVRKLNNTALDSTILNSGGKSFNARLVDATDTPIVPLDTSTLPVYDAATITLIKTVVNTLQTQADADSKQSTLTNQISTAQSSLSNQIVAITTNTARGRAVVPEQLGIPSSGSTTYEIDLNLYTLQGAMEAPDSAPTVHARNASGGSEDSLLTSTSMVLVAVGTTGRYKQSVTLAAMASVREVIFDFSWSVGGQTFTISAAAWITNTYAVDFTASDRNTLQTSAASAASAATSAAAGATSAASADSKATSIQTSLGTINGSISSNSTVLGQINAKTMNLPSNPASSTDVSAVGTAIANMVVSIQNRIGVFSGTGNNTILGAFRAIFRKDTGVVVPSDINADIGGGTGSADNTTDSLQAIRDRGDVAWVGTYSFHGAYTYQVQVVDGSGLPLTGAKVRLTSSDGTQGLDSDINGNAVFAIDANTYTITVTKVGYMATPQTQPVTANGSAIVTMNSTTIPVTPPPGQCLVYGYTLKGSGAIKPNAKMEFQIRERDGGILSRAIETVTSDSNGYFSFPLLPDADYAVRYEGGDQKLIITVPENATTFEITGFLRGYGIQM